MTSNDILRSTLSGALCLTLASLLLAAPADAQEAEPHTSPAFRLDVDLPSVGIGASTLDGNAAMSLGVGLRLAHRSGHGVFASASIYDGDPALNLFGPSRAHGVAALIDAGYLHRLRIAGDDRTGLGLDLEGGLSGGRASFYQPSSGCWFSSSCSPPPQVAEDVADGAYIGPSVGGSLDVRAWGFTIGVDVRYRLLFALDRAEPSDRLDQHVFTAGLHLGFGIY